MQKNVSQNRVLKKVSQKVNEGGCSWTHVDESLCFRQSFVGLSSIDKVVDISDLSLYPESH